MCRLWDSTAGWSGEAGVTRSSLIQSFGIWIWASAGGETLHDERHPCPRMPQPTRQLSFGAVTPISLSKGH